VKIYTKSGDKGETGLLGGVRVSKQHQAIETCGTIDEVNCLVGLVRSTPLREDISQCLRQIQNELFDLGSRVAACLADPTKPPKIANLNDEKIDRLENWIDEFDSELAPLTAFILPSGCRAGCELHLARTVCRRAERALVALINGLGASADNVENEANSAGRDFSIELIYLNRLSDLLFVLARLVNQLASEPETTWQAS